VIGAAVAYGAVFGWLALERHLSGGSHAEDLGFTDQVIWNFLRGQWFRMSIYQGATWNTEIDVARVARPDSLLAFHVEPMLLAFVPLYAAAQALAGALGLAGGQSAAGALAGRVAVLADPAAVLLVVQAFAVGLGALPAFRLGRSWSGSLVGGGAVAAAYLLAPPGQWAVLSDFHTAALAAPLLVLAVERLVVARRPLQAVACAALALTAREDVAPVLALLGLALVALPHPPGPPLPGERGEKPFPPGGNGYLPLPAWRGGRWARSGRVLTLQWSVHTQAWGAAPCVFVVLGLAWIVLCLLVIRHYSGGASPFEVRYGAAFAAPPLSLIQAMTRPSVLGFLGIVLGSGAWLGLLAPLALAPALPTLAVDALSSSPWMASGTAHYSVLVLPFVAIGAAAGLGTLRRPAFGRAWLVSCAGVALVVTALITYAAAGAGPLAANFAPATVTPHALLAAEIAASIPPDAAVSASTSLVPRVSRRARVYVFPALEDADVIFLDVTATPAPTSAGDVFLRARGLLGGGDWSILRAEDGLLLLARRGVGPEDAAPPAGAAAPGLPPTFFTFAGAAAPLASATPIASFLNGDLDLLSATFLPGPDSAVEPDGPRWVFRTTWRATRPLPAGAHPVALLDLDDGEQLRIADVATLWWLPPSDWTPGRLVQVDWPGVPIRRLARWRLEVTPA
jgi:uncharacterized membrane protein